MNQAMQEAAQQGQERLFVEFYMGTMQNELKTKEAGRPIFDDVPWVKIAVPGDKDNIVTRPVRDDDKLRFGKQWQAFERGIEQTQSGQPLSEIPFLTKGQVAEFAVFGIKTAEQLRDMPDVLAQKFQGANGVRQKVKDYLAAAAGNAPLQQIRNENDALRGEIEMLKKGIAELKAQKK